MVLLTFQFAVLSGSLKLGLTFCSPYLAELMLRETKTIMTWALLKKPHRESGVVPNLSDYAEVCSRFSWKHAEQELEGLPYNGGLNIAHEAIDRHANGPLASQLAIRWLGKKGTVDNYSYARLKELTNRFANVLGELGVEPGDRVYTLAGRIPELYI